MTSPAMKDARPVPTSRSVPPDALADAAVSNDSAPDGSDESVASPLAMATAPLEPPTPSPDTRFSAPPVLSPDEPAATVMLPPAESEPPLSPTEMSTEPPPDPSPGSATPTLSRIAPVFPDWSDGAAPVRSVMSPLDASP